MYTTLSVSFYFKMNIFWSFIVIALVMGFTESCMRTVPPDDAYIPVTSAPGETEMPGVMVFHFIKSKFPCKF